MALACLLHYAQMVRLEDKHFPHRAVSNCLMPHFTFVVNFGLLETGFYVAKEDLDLTFWLLLPRGWDCRHLPSTFLTIFL